ncbi:MAG: helix-turn-helix domain-containing protein [Synechococcales bacterium]|nr:helix-turn-helix domain-containing protein [Synechococcales bacterium]
MLLTDQYRLQPTLLQAVTLSHWGELVRRHWNYAPGQRLDWLRRTRSQQTRIRLLDCICPLPVNGKIFSIL